MSAWQIYWLTRCEPLGQLGVGAAIFGGVVAFCFAPFLYEDRKLAKRVLPIAGAMLAVGATIKTLAPTKADIAIIFAGTWATNSAEMQKLPDNVVGVINKYLEEARK